MKGRPIKSGDLDAGAVAADLAAGTLACPSCQAGRLAPWGYGRERASSAVYQGSIVLPDLCNVGDVDLANGGTFTATIG